MHLASGSHYKKPEQTYRPFKSGSWFQDSPMMWCWQSGNILWGILRLRSPQPYSFPDDLELTSQTCCTDYCPFFMGGLVSLCAFSDHLFLQGGELSLWRGRLAAHFERGDWRSDSWGVWVRKAKQCWHQTMLSLWSPSSLLSKEGDFSHSSQSFEKLSSYSEVNFLLPTPDVKTGKYNMLRS